MKLGTVVHFNSTKSFGFIKPDAGGEDIFFHLADGRGVKRSESGPPELVKCKAGAPNKGDVICMMNILPSSTGKKNSVAVPWAYEMDWRAMGGTIPAPDQVEEASDAPMTEEELLKGLEGLALFDPIPSIEELEDAIGGIFGLRQCIMGVVDSCGITMEQLGIFVRNTPDGKKGAALWKEFTHRRDQKDRGEYTFATFVREVVAESKKPLEPVQVIGGSLDADKVFAGLREKVS